MYSILLSGAGVLDTTPPPPVNDLVLAEPKSELFKSSDLILRILSICFLKSWLLTIILSAKLKNNVSL